jgi:type III secretion protein D
VASAPQSPDTSPDERPAGGAEAGSHALEVRTGLYSGVTHGLDEGRHVVGSGEGADLVLVEPGLARRHAAIVLLGSTVRVEGLAEGVTVAGSGPVPPGSARTVHLPATVEIGGVETRWSERAAMTVPGASATGRLASLRLRFRRVATPGLATAGVLAAALFLTFANPIAGASVLLNGSAKSALQRIAGPAQAVAPAVAPAEAAASPARAPDPAQPTGPGATPADGRPRLAVAPQGADAVRSAASTLEREARAAGLLNVHVGSGSGAVTATGFVEPALSGRWEALQQGFDERFAGEITLVNSVAVRAEKLPASLGIEGVWRGSQPYIVLRGQRYFLGAVVDGGWAIRAIERDRVMLEREGRLVAMRF